MTNLDSILKNRGITLPTNTCLVKAMVFSVVMYGYEYWTVKKAECGRIDVFEKWCWRRLLWVPWTARRPVLGVHGKRDWDVTENMNTKHNKNQVTKLRQGVNESSSSPGRLPPAHMQPPHVGIPLVLASLAPGVNGGHPVPGMQGASSVWAAVPAWAHPSSIRSPLPTLGGAESCLFILRLRAQSPQIGLQLPCLEMAQGSPAAFLCSLNPKGAGLGPALAAHSQCLWMTLAILVHLTPYFGREQNASCKPF